MRTADRATILTNERIGPKRSMTPEGFLLCEGVPVARVGWMMYGPGETPVKTNDSGYAMVYRDAAALFHPLTLASFVGKSVTNDHPAEGVEPENWKTVTVGTVHNVRRGVGDDADVLMADLLITDAEAIRDVQAGKREVSAGYDADYEQTGPGEGRQYAIRGNHVALVEKGRCGPRCTIGDQSPHLEQVERTAPMSTTTASPRRGRRKIMVDAATRRAILDAAAEGMASALEPPEGEEMEHDTDGPYGTEEGGDNHVHVHLHAAERRGEDADEEPEAGANAEPAEAEAGAPWEARLAALEKGHVEILDRLNRLLGMEAEEAEERDGEDEDGEDEGETGDELPLANPEDDDMQTPKPKTQDSQALATGFRGMVADAEVLVPGFRVPTFDAKQTRQATIDAMCSTRRRALSAFAATREGARILGSLTGDKKLDTRRLACDRLAFLFKSAAGAKRLLNNRTATGDIGTLQIQNDKPKGVPTIAELNALHRKLFPH